MNQNSLGPESHSPAPEARFSNETFKDEFREGRDFSEAGPGPGGSARMGGASDPASTDFSLLRDDIAKLTRSISELAKKQTSTARDQIVGAIGAAGDNISQSASDAQDKLMSIEQDVGARIKSNPWSAVAIAGLIGLLIGKMS